MPRNVVLKLTLTCAIFILAISFSTSKAPLITLTRSRSASASVKLTSACVRAHVLSRQRSISEQFLQDICHAISRAAPA